ncbi:MAG: class I SAM-dependent methyltransferase [Parcubacteria group bacterium]|nr:class I SAM-dependent methyltransferase [Parcubacteria group bacterium]
MIFQPDRYLLKKQIEELSHFLKGTILDIGSGPNGGRYKNFFSGNDYITLDINPDYSPDIIGSAERIPAPDNSFDGVVCFQVLDDLKNPAEAIKEMSRVLKAGGYGMLSVPQSNELHDEPNDYWRFTKYGVVVLLSEAGLEIIKILPRGGFWALKAQITARYLIDLLGLYKRKILGRLLNLIFLICGITSIWLDVIDRSQANRKHTLGWMVLFKKS